MLTDIIENKISKREAQKIYEIHHNPLALLLKREKEAEKLLFGLEKRPGKQTVLTAEEEQVYMFMSMRLMLKAIRYLSQMGKTISMFKNNLLDLKVELYEISLERTWKYDETNLTNGSWRTRVIERRSNAPRDNKCSSCIMMTPKLKTICWEELRILTVVLYRERVLNKFVSV